MSTRSSRHSQPWDAGQAASEIAQRVQRDFAPEDQGVVHECLLSILLEHTTMSSEANLHAVRLAVAELAKGDPVRVLALTERAKRDFRDVLFWLEIEHRGGVVPPLPETHLSAVTEDAS